MQVCRDAEAFTALAEDWERLYTRCAAATPFQSFGWVASWWQEYGVPGRLRLVLVRRDDSLVAVAPLMLRRTLPCRVLVPIGADESDFTDVLLDDACRDEATRVLADGLLDQPGWHVLDVPEARPGAAAERLFDAWPGGRWRSHGSTCLRLPAGTLDEFLARLPTSTAGKLRAKARKVEASGIAAREVTADEVEGAIDALLRLHHEQWRGRGINQEHLRARFRRHLARAVRRMVERGQAALVEYRMDGRLVACDLDLIGHRFVGTYLAGYQPALRRRVDVAVMMLAEVLALAERRGLPALDLLRGTEPYKMHWRPAVTRNDRLLLAGQGRRVLPRGYAAAVRLRSTLADLLRERLPWLRALRFQTRQAVARMRGSRR